MRRYCRNCGEHLIRANRGPAPAYCSTRCRVAAHRSGKIPAELTERHAWTRCFGKRPIRTDGRPASTTNPSTWATFAEVRSGPGEGFGVMLGDGLGCYDLDHVSDEAARSFIAGIPEEVVFVERSMSGEGVHIFVRTWEPKGSRQNGIEFYPRSRFIRMTGKRFS